MTTKEKSNHYKQKERNKKEGDQKGAAEGCRDKSNEIERSNREKREIKEKDKKRSNKKEVNRAVGDHSIEVVRDNRRGDKHYRSVVQVLDRNWINLQFAIKEKCVVIKEFELI